MSPDSRFPPLTYPMTITLLPQTNPASLSQITLISHESRFKNHKSLNQPTSNLVEDVHTIVLITS